MSKLTRTIVVKVPIEKAYKRWSDLESFPSFMDGVESVEQLDDTHYRWQAEVGGHHERWEAEITERVPNHRIEWRYTRGARNAGVVSFNELSHDTTLVTLQLGYDPQGPLEVLGDKLGLVERRIESDLESFKRRVEQ